MSPAMKLMQALSNLWRVIQREVHCPVSRTSLYQTTAMTCAQANIKALHLWIIHVGVSHIAES